MLNRLRVGRVQDGVVTRACSDRWRTLLILSAISLATRVSEAQIGDGRVGYACNTRGTALDLLLPANEPQRIDSLRKAGQMVQIVETLPLVQYEAIPDTDVDLRVGTREVSSRCGVFSVRVTAGWLNPRTAGALGAVEFPIVDVAVGDLKVLPPTSFGECHRSDSMFTDAGCPDSWATHVGISWDPQRHEALVTAGRYFREQRVVKVISFAPAANEAPKP